MPSMYDSYEKELEITAEKARSTGMWFIHRSNGEWITPEHYIMHGLTNRIQGQQGDRSIFIDYVIADPKKGNRGED